MDREPQQTVKPGLCESCIRAKVVRSGKGSAFWMCGKHFEDSRYPKYPRLPVLGCDGYSPKADA